MDTKDTIKGKKILIIEDDRLLHNLLADKMMQLREKGIEVYPTMNAEEGMAKAVEVHPDLILLDIVLPGMTGFEFLERLRKEAGLEKTPVIILSNLNADTDKERARSLGALAYLVKANLSLSEISKTVESVLHGQQITPPKEAQSDARQMLTGSLVYL
ncbi:hypothetical protein A3I46_00245 [Candidatus Kaiserbacteria bacterium RIFCSPLOWO2_02_FULL_54_13]|uniref:Response regulatory domain-containing protein n=1 Tax=Candidatus Kaiserbacteria bacterium RIFCSPHIGHO2_02_FULL_54_22 TaxID=1798495 RepID=A0A1F6DK59_9BACT|nr:MAG: two component transcriptional regulator [Parcubacteria group bacterium GW2011_GWA1_54_9]KKW41960.1 MAG: two component transcriptional regulator [Parcubacteria group bacterium GW2011_GWB1_55_9]OGG61793.1 MAG: hypothetical protein A3C19_00880 [Candidatus Kaiserbacteria bacterium RIFCSPHIGHO2_02_FULL_54_22]OGG68128.1 MAG: hypothetical protein A3E99_00475 [Candidatus Kaiserbacteria bacterium RIFCSPHIGHO2_12_FULL_54_16]OGG83217.1 MAG: hypothetical protein A3I46_00245 [Candidatus Kaiserbacter